MNENEFKNYYQILGIDKSVIDYVIYDKKKDGKYENKLRNEASKDKKIKHKKESKKKQEESTMTKTMKIEGMMCGHCEARVKKALESVDGVSGAVVSHEKNEAVVTLAKEVDDEVLKKAVEEQDYKVIAIN